MFKLATLALGLFSAQTVDAGAAFTKSTPSIVTTCNRVGSTTNKCSHGKEVEFFGGPHGPGVPSRKIYGDWIQADDKPITLKVEGAGGKRFLSIPVSFISQVMTMTNSSSSGDHTTEAEAKVEAMVRVTINKGLSSEMPMTVYPPKVTMLERDQKLTVTADNLACLVEIEDEWVLCSDASDEDCQCGVNVGLAVSETVATTFDFYAYPILESGIATVELFYRLSGFVKVDDNMGEVPPGNAFSAGVVYNTMMAELLQMPAWE